ncbi:MAG TPA: hypothetical protein VK308_12405, partial [Pyrinomonadaceae bacterium]|nr:hypothetical protein [Pyrinomonadaceae bacterium]
PKKESAKRKEKTKSEPTGENSEDVKNTQRHHSISKQVPVLLSFRIDPIVDPKKKNKIVDYMVELVPSPAFSSETMKANRIEKSNKMNNDKWDSSSLVK